MDPIEQLVADLRRMQAEGNRIERISIEVGIATPDDEDGARLRDALPSWRTTSLGSHYVELTCDIEADSSRDVEFDP
jgi:hypothetical protein